MDEKEILKLSLKDKFGSKKEATSANFAELIDAVFNYPGKNGTDGTNGVPGTNGKPGLDGKIGEPGKNGTNGEAGKEGKAGTNGAPGAEGKVGPDASKDIKEINIVKNAEGKTLSVNLTFTDESKRPVMIIPVIETIK